MKHVEVKDCLGAISADELLSGLKESTPKAVALAVDELSKRRLCVSLDDMQTSPAYVAEKQSLEETASDRRVLDEYFADMAKLEHTSCEFEYRAFKENDREGITKVVEASLHIVPEIAELYLKNLTMDVLSDANFAILTAAKHYDPDKYGEFSLFAAIYVRYAIINSLLDIDEHDKLIEKLSPKEGDIKKEPKRAKASQGIPAATVSRKLLHRKMGLHAHKEECCESEKTEQNSDNLSATIKSALSKLDEDEAFVINSLFGLSGETLSENAISDILGVTEARVAEIKERALAKLRSVQR